MTVTTSEDRIVSKREYYALHNLNNYQRSLTSLTIFKVIACYNEVRLHLIHTLCNNCYY